MTYYEICNCRDLWVVWKCTANGAQCERFKSFKTKKSAENWAAKQVARVIWR